MPRARGPGLVVPPALKPFRLRTPASELTGYCQWSLRDRTERITGAPQGRPCVRHNPLRHSRFSLARAILLTLMNLSLNSKVALITGGSRGIGAAAVRSFAAAGAKVVFNYQSAKGQAEDLVKECGAENCRALPSDLSTTEAAQKLV